MGKRLLLLLFFVKMLLMLLGCSLGGGEWVERNWTSSDITMFLILGSC